MIALVMAQRGDHAAAGAEDRDVLTVQLQVLGPDHPDTLATAERVNSLAARTT